MAANSDWAAASDCTADVNGIVAFTDFQLRDTAGEFETSNLAGPRDANNKLLYEGGTDTRTIDFSGNVVVDKDAIGTVTTTGSLVPGVVITMPDGRYYSGSLIVSSHSFTGAAKGEYKYAIAGKFTGEVDFTAPVTP